MDPFLAEIYGTRETIGAADDSDQEKLAEADFIAQMCNAEGIDVEDISDEDAVKIAYEIWGEDSAIVKEAAEAGAGDEGEEDEDEDEEEETMEEKAAQADQLGRIMAHSFVQEQAFIEKEAKGGKLLQRAGAWLKKPLETFRGTRYGGKRTVQSVARTRGAQRPSHVKGRELETAPRSAVTGKTTRRRRLKAPKKGKIRSETGAQSRAYALEAVGRKGPIPQAGKTVSKPTTTRRAMGTPSKGWLKSVGETAKKHKVHAALAAGVPLTAVGGGTAAVLASRKGKKKAASASVSSSDIEEYSVKLAFDMVEDAGYDTDEFVDMLDDTEFAKTASAYPVEHYYVEDEEDVEKLAEILEENAFDMLEEMGYPVG